MVKSALILIMMESMIFIGWRSNMVAVAGKIVIYLSVLAYIIASLVQHHGKVRVDRLVLALLLTMFAYFMTRSTDALGVGSSFQLLILICSFVAFMYGDKVSGAMLNMIAWVTFGTFTLFFLLSPGLGLFANGNYVSALAFIYGVFLYANVRSRWLRRIVGVIALAMIVVAGARSVLLGILLASVYTWVLFFSRFGKRGRLLILVFATLCIFIGAYFVSGLIGSVGFNDWLLSHTGKRLESGRLEMWRTLFNNFSARDFAIGAGGGAGLDALMGVDTRLSAHSLYVYVLAAYGGVGLVLLIFVFWRILLLHYRRGFYFSFFMCLALMVRDAFEVSLIHNNFPIAVFFWTMCASGFLELCARRSIYKHNEALSTKHFDSITYLQIKN